MIRRTYLIQLVHQRNSHTPEHQHRHNVDVLQVHPTAHTVPYDCPASFPRHTTYSLGYVLRYVVVPDDFQSNKKVTTTSRVVMNVLLGSFSSSISISSIICSTSSIGVSFLSLFDTFIRRSIESYLLIVLVLCHTFLQTFCIGSNKSFLPK